MEFIPFLGALIGAIIAAAFHCRNNRAREKADHGPVPTGLEPRRQVTISAELRAELDQTPQWWDREYHRLLVASGATPIKHGEAEMVYIQDSSIVGGTFEYSYEIPAPTEFPECSCAKCRSIRLRGDVRG